MTSQEPEEVRVFISYSHDSLQHENNVLQLSNRLRKEGVNCYIDQYERSPAEGWPRWMNQQVDFANYILVVGTEIYEKRFKGQDEPGKGRGVKWEGAIITQELYEAEAKNKKFIPVVFSPKDVDHIPIVLKGATYYTLGTNQGYDDLYAYLTYQRRILKPKLGKLRQLSPVEEENIQKPIITAESLVPFQGRCFKQINNSNESMNAKEIEEMHLRSTVYYHVRITQKSDILGELKLDLSEEKLCSQFITPYENGENIFVNGKTITSDDIERIRINKTELNSSKLIPIIRAKRPKIGAPQISNEWLVTKEGEDVTDDLIKGEPGYKKKKFGEKMEEVKPKTNPCVFG